jgi:outer membrane protein assembly factor BamB
VNREADAMDKIRVYARPAPNGPAAVDGGRFAATYFRVALGLDASSGGPLWARIHDADFIGGAAYRGGFALCDAAGVVTFLDAATGGVSGRVALGKPVSACLVQADAITMPAAPREAPLLDQLERITRAREPDIQGLRPAVLREMALLGATGSGGG